MNKNEVIVITGGSGKFGRVLLKHFLSHGHTIVTTCQSENSLINLEKEYKELYPEKLYILKTDLTEPNQEKNLVQFLNKNKLTPSSLINNARSLNFLKIDENGNVPRSNFMGEFLMDVIVPYELTMALANNFNKKLKKIVNVGSMYGLVAANPSLYTDPLHQSPIHYGVAKAALIHLTKELSIRLAPNKIAVNCVAYGGVDGRVDESFKSRYKNLCPIGRMLREDEISGPIDWLLSNSSSGMTGQTIVIDGGWTVW